MQREGQPSFVTVPGTLSQARSDTSFDTDGKVFTDGGILAEDVGNSVTVQPDGKILVAGESDYDFAVIRYNTNGSLDTTFKSNTLDATPTYTEGGAAVVLDSNVEIYDAELAALNSGFGNYNGATVTLARHGGASSQDVFSASGTLGALTEGANLTVGGTTIGIVTTNSSGTLTFTFNASATQALAEGNSSVQGAV